MGLRNPNIALFERGRGRYGPTSHRAAQSLYPAWSDCPAEKGDVLFGGTPGSWPPEILLTYTASPRSRRRGRGCRRRAGVGSGWWIRRRCRAADAPDARAHRPGHLRDRPSWRHRAAQRPALALGLTRLPPPSGHRRPNYPSPPPRVARRRRGCPRLVHGADPLDPERRCGQGVGNPTSTSKRPTVTSPATFGIARLACQWQLKTARDPHRHSNPNIAPKGESVRRR